MEGLLPFIIMLILGALFNSGKKKKSDEKQKPAKPFTTEQPKHDNPIKKLKEMSRDLYHEIQQEFEVEEEKPKHEPVRIPKVERAIKEPNVKSRVALAEGRQQSAVRQSPIKKQVPKKRLVPTSSDEIMQGIIFSEIIGPPKSKR